MTYLVLDIATTTITEAESLIDGDTISAPSNYRDQAKIDAYIAEKKAERLERAALDVDLNRITMLGWSLNGLDPEIEPCRTEDDERDVLAELSMIIGGADHYADRPAIITYNGAKFDLPVLMRRCAYLGLPIPTISLDRYRSPHQDLSELLTFRGALPPKPLSFYCRRLGWTDLVKPLTGAEEAKAALDGRWEDLRASVAHDLEATTRLARWLRVLPKVKEAEPVL